MLALAAAAAVLAVVVHLVAVAVAMAMEAVTAKAAIKAALFRLLCIVRVPAQMFFQPIRRRPLKMLFRRALQLPQLILLHVAETPLRSALRPYRCQVAQTALRATV